MDPLIKSQLLYQLSYTPVPAPGPERPGGEGAEHTRKRGVGKHAFRDVETGSRMARRDLTGAVDFAYLEGFAAGDAQVIEEVLALFREQAAVWTRMLDPGSEGWRDAVHTIKGSSRGIGAFALGDVCEQVEAGALPLDAVRDALDVALADVAAYAHERALQSLRTPRR